MSTRIVVDWTRCDAHGLCAELLPEVVELDDWGYPVLADGGRVADDLRVHALHAVSVCPQLALVLKK
ncbi:MAG TPA: ferredoxin [Nocardioidaceae bacterium]|nr:ferredoxin [Nocardioidaceae bacterium]